MTVIREHTHFCVNAFQSVSVAHSPFGPLPLCPQVIRLTSFAVPALAISLVGEGANTVLAGVLRGCGRQKIGATINLLMCAMGR